ncbi:MAG: hypothetical protein GKR89_12335 [Candidatus Latescibacteria bacterium]|nr:hypothetical protein [Candidatus Latescibacterota bacterium]
MLEKVDGDGPISDKKHRDAAEEEHADRQALGYASIYSDGPTSDTEGLFAYDQEQTARRAKISYLAYLKMLVIDADKDGHISDEERLVAIKADKIAEFRVKMRQKPDANGAGTVSDEERLDTKHPLKTAKAAEAGKIAEFRVDTRQKLEAD